MFYSGSLQVKFGLADGKDFATCLINIKQSLRQRSQLTLVAYEGDVIECATWKKIGTITMLVKHTGQFVNPEILARMNRNPQKRGTVKKVRARDPQWLKIKTSESDQEIVPDEIEKISRQEKEAETPDERKLQRIAAFKARQNRQIIQRSTMKVQPQKVCTHSRSRSGSRDSSPNSSMNRPMSASLVAAGRERCIQPQIVHMTEEKYIQQKKESFKPAMMSDLNQVIVGER